VPCSQALLEAAGHDGEAGPVQGLGDCGELGDHLLAVAALLEEAEHAGELALCALDPVDDGGHLGGVELHQFSSDRADRAAVRRCLASAVTEANATLSVSPIIASGSKASTIV